MGKRVSNKKGKHAGARSGRVKLHHSKRYILSQLREAQSQIKSHATKSEHGAEVVKEALATVRAKIRQIVPNIRKRVVMMRRGVQ